MANANFIKDVEAFKGKRFSPAERQAIFDRVKQLIFDKVEPDVAVTILNGEGFRRVDGSKVTISWVEAKYDRVKKAYKSEKTRDKSGPVKTVYTAQSKAITKEVKRDTSELNGLLEAVMNCNLEAKYKISLVKMLGS